METFNKTSKVIIIAAAIFLVITFGCQNKAAKKQPGIEDLTVYVNPFIGTHKEGHTFPGAC
ncbi:hypothetical protein, partial [Maribellus maritimus]|uniref:hypothetical protein n=1 Tax=Maribellus maritimus TaxID=2870838 RepID=UPI001EEA2889